MDAAITNVQRNRRSLLIGLVKVFFTKIAQWHEIYRSRKRLSEIPDHLLEDVGLTKEQAQIESRKPFWQ